MRTRFDYTEVRLEGGLVVKRPCIDVVLSRDDGRPGARPTPRVQVLIDSGSDSCMFDWALAAMMRLNLDSSGHATQVEGLGALIEARLVDISMRIPDLESGPIELQAHFCQLGRGIAGVLGHIGFLQHFDVTFVKGSCFEIVDHRPAPVIDLKPK